MLDPSSPIRSRDLAEAMPHIVWTHDPDGKPTYFNRSWVDYTGHDLDAVLREGAEAFVHPDDRATVVRLFDEARRTGAALETTYRLRRHDGAYRWHLARIAPVRDDDGNIARWVGTALDVDERRRSDVERAFLANAGTILGSSLDVERTLSDVARLVVPELADWCAIDLVGENGALVRSAVAHVDPAKVELAHRLWRQQPPRPDDAHGVYAVLRNGKTEWLPEIPDELLTQTVADPALLTIIRGLGLRSSLCVPLTGRERTLGALTLVAAESGRGYDEHDLAFAEDLARRIAIAIENAQLYRAARQARETAEALAQDVVNQTAEVRASLEALRAERDEALTRLAKLERGEST
jgi:PAS domain S-box-containing protein